MHKYMRAIGFSHFDNKRKLQELLTEVVVNPDKRGITLNPENEMIGEFSKDFAPGLGITVCGEFENEEKFTYEYYYPYLEGTGISSCEDVSVERHAEKDSYAGVCDDIKVGISKTDGKYVEIIDRKEAIAYVIRHGQPGDVIVLAGKGH